MSHNVLKTHLDRRNEEWSLNVRVCLWDVHYKWRRQDPSHAPKFVHSSDCSSREPRSDDLVKPWHEGRKLNLKLNARKLKRRSQNPKKLWTNLSKRTSKSSIQRNKFKRKRLRRNRNKNSIERRTSTRWIKRYERTMRRLSWRNPR